MKLFDVYPLNDIEITKALAPLFGMIMETNI